MVPRRRAFLFRFGGEVFKAIDLLKRPKWIALEPLQLGGIPVAHNFLEFASRDVATADIGDDCVSRDVALRRDLSR